VWGCGSVGAGRGRRGTAEYSTRNGEL
jgi:hypothetical protein